MIKSWGMWLKIFCLGVLILEFVSFIFLKQQLVQLRRANERLESLVNAEMNERNLSRVQMAQVQNGRNTRKLVEKYLAEYGAVKPSQIISKESI